ncbi:histidine kinase [Paenibacillus sp. TRM 82003]|nr:histidine kinase [Paenibacillus sp. TRM 82003]
MVIGYFIIVFIPVSGFGLYYYNQLYESMIEEYASGKQQIIEQAYANLRMDLLQLESHYVLFQYNTNVIQYLNGAYDSDWEYVYHFRKEISPLLAFALYGNSNIKDIRIYKDNERVFTVPNQVIHREALPRPLRGEIEGLAPGNGRWFYNRANTDEWSLVYYQNLYAERFTKLVGVLAVQVDQRLEDRFIETLSNERRSEVYVFPRDSHTTTLDSGLVDRIRNEPSGYFFLENKGQIVNHLRIDQLGVKIAVVSQAEDVFVKMGEKKTFLFIAIVGLLLLLSGMYYMLASSITKRLLRLARHMRNVGENNFRIIEHRQDQDEIGYLTYSYNSMLQRMDDLVNKIQRSELLRKEAAYKVLQAQVKPHFLYNTLETIRMLAEVNDDDDVADVAFSFGQLMRYSLSNYDDEVKLGDEMKNIDHFINIHKRRLGKRLDFEYEVIPETLLHRCPRFILQPLVENCIVHGLATRKTCKIKIVIRETEDHVYIEVSDDGVGIPEQRLHKVKQMLSHAIDIGDFSTNEGGHGLYNVSERLKAFYGGESRLELESKEGFGTTFKLFLDKKRMLTHVEASDSR